MALKAKLTEAEFTALAEPLKEHYKKNGDGYILDAEGVEDVTGLKSALAAKTKERNELKAALEAEAAKWKDLDPERARAALTAVAELEDKKLVDKGEYDRIIAKKQKDFDDREVEYQKQIAEQGKRLDTYELINPLRDALLKAGVIPDRIEDALLSGSRFVRLDDRRKVIVLDKDGDASGKSLEEFAAGDFKESKPWLYAASGAGGSGATQTNGIGAGKKTITRKDFDVLPPMEQAAIATKNEVTITD